MAPSKEIELEVLEQKRGKKLYKLVHIEKKVKLRKYGEGPRVFKGRREWKAPLHPEYLNYLNWNVFQDFYKVVENCKDKLISASKHL